MLTGKFVIFVRFQQMSKMSMPIIYFTNSNEGLSPSMKLNRIDAEQI